MERGLECLSGTGLSGLDRLGVINLVGGYVLGHHRLYDELERGARAEGLPARRPSARMPVSWDA